MDQVKPIRLVLLTVLVAVLTAYTYVLRYRSAESPKPPSLELIPKNIAGYTGVDEYQEPEFQRLLGADATLFRSYSNDEGDIIWLFIGYFGTQHENSQIHSPKHCYPGSGWDIVHEGSIGIPFGGDTAPVKHLIISNRRERREVVYWFSMHGGIITNEFALKWHQMKSALLGKSQDAAFIRFSTNIQPGQEKYGRESLLKFLEVITRNIEASLNNARASGVSPGIFCGPVGGAGKDRRG